MITCKRDAYTNTLSPQGITPSTSPAATARLKALCHFHHERVSIETTNFSLFNLLLLSADAFIFQSRAWIFQGWVTDPVKNEKWEGVGGRVGREVRGGMDNHIWFCRSHKWLKLCRFQSDYLRLRHLHRFPSVTAFPSPLLSVWYLTSLWWPGKKKLLMLAVPNFTVPQWACVGAAPVQPCLSSPGSVIPQLPYYQQTRISISKL